MLEITPNTNFVRKQKEETQVSPVMSTCLQLCIDIDNEENSFKKTQLRLMLSKLIRKYNIGLEDVEKPSEIQENESVGHQSKYEQLKKAAIKLRKAQDALVKCKDRGVRSQIAQDVVKIQHAFDKMIGLKS